MYYVTAYLKKIAQNPEKLYISKIIFAFCCWLQVAQDHSRRKPQRGNVPTNVPSSDSVFSLVSQSLLFATKLMCQLWLSE